MQVLLDELNDIAYKAAVKCSKAVINAQLLKWDRWIWLGWNRWISKNNYTITFSERGWVTKKNSIFCFRDSLSHSNCPGLGLFLISVSRGATLAPLTKNYIIFFSFRRWFGTNDRMWLRRKQSNCPTKKKWRLMWRKILFRCWFL